MSQLLLLLASAVLADSALTTKYNCPDRCHCHPSSLKQQRLVVNCSNLDFEEIPRDLDPATLSLDLSNNHIQIIEKGSFDNLPYLSTLLLNNNRIRTIDAHAFRNLNNIRKLDLRGNRLTTLGPDTLSRIQGAVDCSHLDPCSINLQVKCNVY